MTLKHIIYRTSLLKSLAGHIMLVGVNPCGRCVVVAPLPQNAKLTQKPQNYSLNICELIWVGTLPLFHIRTPLCHLEMIWVEVRSEKPTLVSFLSFRNQPWFNFPSKCEGNWVWEVRNWYHVHHFISFHKRDIREVRVHVSNANGPS